MRQASAGCGSWTRRISANGRISVLNFSWRSGVRSIVVALSIVAFAAPGFASTPVDSPAHIAFGKALFFDQRLSVDGTLSCASCHDPAEAYADGRALSVGRGGAVGVRNTPSLLTSAHYSRWSASGQHETLAAQVLEPLFAANEHGFSSEREVTTLIRDTPEFAALYRTAFGSQTPFKISAVAQSLAAFVRSLAVSPAITAGIESDATLRGRALFAGKAQCASCHLPQQAFTDNRFHLGAGGAVERRAAVIGAMNQSRLRVSDGKYQRTASAEVARLGAFVATLDPADVGKFRTPSLLHVARTAPYFHDGSGATLREAILIEVKRNPQLQLSTVEIDDLLGYVREIGVTAFR
jgi:cytochrome c peroxidase